MRAAKGEWLPGFVCFKTHKIQVLLTSNGLIFQNKVDLSKAACTEKK